MRYVKTSSEIMDDVLFVVENNIMTESDITEMRNKIKDIENKLKEKIKPKTITIPGSVHNVIKSYCTSLNLNIGEWASDVLLKEIKDQSAFKIEDLSYEDMIERDSNIIKEKYTNELIRDKFLIKSNKILMSKELIFIGYSSLDSLPIYESKFDLEKLNSKFENSLDLDGHVDSVKIVESYKDEISLNIFYNENLPVVII